MAPKKKTELDIAIEKSVIDLNHPRTCKITLPDGKVVIGIPYTEKSTRTELVTRAFNDASK